MGIGPRGRGGGEGVRTRDHLANTRTLLSWLRLGVTLIAIGFVINKLGLLEGTGVNPYERTIGLVVAILGTAMSAGSMLRFLRQRNSIESAVFTPRYRSDVALAMGAVVAGIGLILVLGTGR